nr:hypothetical protein [Tanacetum cinerariifolium]
MVNMVPHETFACSCAEGDVVLRQSYKHESCETRLRQLMSSPEAPSAGPSTPPIYSLGPSTPPSYSLGPSTPPSYSSGSSRNAECSNCKHLRGKISVLKATINMHMHLEQHTVNSAALLHEVLNEMEKLDLEYATSQQYHLNHQQESPKPQTVNTISDGGYGGDFERWWQERVSSVGLEEEMFVCVRCQEKTKRWRECDDGVLGRLKFVSKGEDNQVYEILIPDVMLNSDIKKSMAYHTYLAIPMGIVVLKKARKGMKTPATPNKKGLITAADNIIPDPEEALKLGKLISKMEVPDEPKGKTADQDDDWGSDEEEEIICIDDEETESEKDAAKSEKTDEKTTNEEEVHSDKEVHTDDEELHADNEANDDEYVHDDGEKHDDTDEEMSDDENADELKDDQEMDDLEKFDSKKIKEEKVDSKQARADQDAHDDQIGALIFVTWNEKQNYHHLPSVFLCHLTMTTPTPLPTPPTLDEAIVRGDVDPTKFLKRRRHDDEDQEPPPDSKKEKTKQRRNDVESSKKSSTSKESSKGKTQSKPLSIDKLMNAEEPLHEAEIDMEERILNDVVNDTDQLQDEYNPKKDNSTWFKQPPDQKLLIHSGTKIKLLMMEQNNPSLMIRIELEYNTDQCYNALTDQLDWINPEGDRCPYELSKPLPLQGSPGHLTILVDFFFNNDLEYLRTENSKGNTPY